MIPVLMVFLGNLRDYESFIKTDSVWNATQTTATTKPAETTMISDAVGLLNAYEYTKSYSGTDYSNGYLNNGLYWWTLTHIVRLTCVASTAVATRTALVLRIRTARGRQSI